MNMQGSAAQAKDSARAHRSSNGSADELEVENARLGRGSASSHQPVAPFRVTTERNGRKLAWLSLFGQLDLRSAGVLARQLLSVEGRVGRVVLDARGLSFLDAVGLHVLLHASQRAKRGGWDLAVIQGSKPIDRLFRFPDIARRLRLVDDPADLLA